MTNVLDQIAESTGVFTRESISQLGAIARFFLHVLRALPAAFVRFHLIVEQMMVLGVKTIPIVLLTSAFVGLVSAWQVQYLFSDVMPLTYLGAAVSKAIFTELGPVLTALVITGRIGARLAAELGTMRVTEQIDAMTCLALDPYTYLLAPRMVAGAIMVPMLTIFSAFFAIISAQLLAQLALGLDPATFYNGLRKLFRVQDVVICLVKAFVFGVSISLSGCYFGFLTTGGAVGVGESTKKAVVLGMVLIMISNLIVVNILL
jgi:phospholipid/cholesterol/gamma-HCH transport system permease protein